MLAEEYNSKRINKHYSDFVDCIKERVLNNETTQGNESKISKETCAQADAQTVNTMDHAVLQQ